MIKMTPTLLIIGMLLGLYFLSPVVIKQSAKLFPVKYVRTEGAFEYIAKEDIKQKLKPLVSSGFLAADIQRIQYAVNTLPWVQKVEVERVWPDAIEIKVYEQKPYVRWGKTGLLNAKGELFEPDNLNKFSDLPLIIGPDKQEKKTLEIMKGLRVALLDKALDLWRFEINERRAWRLVLVNEMEVQLGRSEQLSHFQRFLKTLKMFKEEEVMAIAKVDLRYPNGFSIAWKPESEKPDWKKVSGKTKQFNQRVKHVQKST